MKDLVIIGAGNVGGFLALNQDLFNVDYNLIGFLDDDITKVDKVFWGIPVLGRVADYINYGDVAFVIGISFPTVKVEIIKMLGLGFEFPSFIAKNAWVSNRVKIGEGVIIYPGVSINHESEIGNFSVINMNCSIGHNSVVSSFCSLAPGVNLGGFTHLDEQVEMGIGSSTLQGIKIGAKTRIGGQSMVIEHANAHSTYIGVPAKKKH